MAHAVAVGPAVEIDFSDQFGSIQTGRTRARFLRRHGANGDLRSVMGLNLR